MSCKSICELTNFPSRLNECPEKSKSNETFYCQRHFQVVFYKLCKYYKVVFTCELTYRLRILSKSYFLRTTFYSKHFSFNLSFCYTISFSFLTTKIRKEKQCYVKKWVFHHPSCKCFYELINRWNISWWLLFYDWLYNKESDKN